MSEAVPPGIDAEAVGRFFADRVPGGAGPLRFSLISGGRSNLTYRVERSDRAAGAGPWVLRRPPLGHVLPTAHDMAREYRVLAALADTDVPVPRPFALCEDAALNGAPFYVMAYTPGVVVNESAPAGYLETPAARRAASLALVENLVRLHAVDFEAVGLGDFGRPAGYLERQLRRWRQQWERSKTREVPEIDAIVGWLRERLPESPPPTIVHGDYRLGNLALDPDDPGRVVAIFDWEMATLGDPLADLGYTLIYWGEEGDPPEQRTAYMGVTAQPGFLTRAELVAAYAHQSGRDAAHIAWYQVLALYKLAVISEGIYARHRQGKTVGEGFQRFESQVTQLLARARSLCTG